MKKNILFMTLILVITLLMAACGGVKEDTQYKVSISDGVNEEVHCGDDYYLRNRRESNVISITLYEGNKWIYNKTAEGLVVTVERVK